MTVMSTSSSRTFLCFLTTVVITTGEHPSTSLTILYNSGKSDGHFQGTLLKGVLIGIRNAGADYPTLPHLSLINLSEFDIETSVDWLISNGTNTLISLLSGNQLKQFCHVLASRKLNTNVRIFTPRNLPYGFVTPSEFIRVTSLEMSQEGRIMALLHRIMKVGTQSLLPVLDDQSQVPLLRRYSEVAARIHPELKFKPPVFMSQNSTWISDPTFTFSSAGTNATGEADGILLLFPNGINAKVQRKLVEEDHFFRWFSHEGLHEWDQSRRESAHGMFGLYSVQYVGSTNWDNPGRRRILKELNSFTGPSPTIISAVLAYDTATLALNHFWNLDKQEASLPSDTTGLSGNIHFNKQGVRADGVFYGILTLPSTKKGDSFSNILQPSDWLLEDVLEIREENGEATFGEYHMATTSIFSRNELLHVAKEGRGMRKCGLVEMEVMTHDSFNQIQYRYTFNQKTLPSHILIPNEYGYGLEFRCHGNSSSQPMTALKIACTPDRSPTGQSVNCFTSGVKRTQRLKRSRYSQPSYRAGAMDPILTESSSHNMANRVSEYKAPGTNSWNSYQQAPVNSSYKSTNHVNGYHSQDFKTQGEKTTQQDNFAKKDLSLPGLGNGKDPDSELRRVFKSTKPFLGSCIGTTAGCGACLFVLGTFQIGATRTACFAPCFMGGFGTCGSLIGRAVAEVTVICTELFRQGLLDVDTFLADAEFGRRIAKESPKTLLGYQTMATPLVEKMKESDVVTKVVAYFALPWTKHMKYLIGTSEEFSWSGYFIHTIGSGFCYVFGHILTTLHVGIEVKSLGYTFMSLLISLIFIVTKFKTWLKS